MSMAEAIKQIYQKKKLLQLQSEYSTEASKRINTNFIKKTMIILTNCAAKQYLQQIKKVKWCALKLKKAIHFYC